jgi:hypothetical protein
MPLFEASGTKLARELAFWDNPIYPFSLLTLVASGDRTQQNNRHQPYMGIF